MSNIDPATGTWVLAMVGTNSYLGLLQGEYGTAEDLREHVFEAMDEKRPLGFTVLFVYLEQIVQDPKTGQLGKQPITLPFSLTTTPLDVWKTIDGVVWLDDMSEDDRKIYQKLIQNGLDSMAKTRAARSGLVLPQ